MTPDLRKWIDHVKSTTEAPTVDLSTHIPTEGELNNLTYLSMKFLVNWQMRHVEFVLLKGMAGEIKSIDDVKAKFIPQIAQYIWSHLMRKPDAISINDLQEAIEALMGQLYAMDEFKRNSIEMI